MIVTGGYWCVGIVDIGGNLDFGLNRGWSGYFRGLSIQ